MGENVGSNPALHFFRGLRHRNLAAIKLAAQSGINQIQGQKSAVDQIQVIFEQNFGTIFKKLYKNDYCIEHLHQFH